MADAKDDYKLHRVHTTNDFNIDKNKNEKSWIEEAEPKKQSLGQRFRTWADKHDKLIGGICYLGFATSLIAPNVASMNSAGASLGQMASYAGQAFVVPPLATAVIGGTVYGTVKSAIYVKNKISNFFANRKAMSNVKKLSKEYGQFYGKEKELAEVEKSLNAQGKTLFDYIKKYEDFHHMCPCHTVNQVKQFVQGVDLYQKENDCSMRQAYLATVDSFNRQFREYTYRNEIEKLEKEHNVPADQKLTDDMKKVMFLRFDEHSRSNALFKPDNVYTKEKAELLLADANLFEANKPISVSFPSRNVLQVTQEKNNSYRIYLDFGNVGFSVASKEKPKINAETKEIEFAFTPHNVIRVNHDNTPIFRKGPCFIFKDFRDFTRELKDALANGDSNKKLSLARQQDKVRTLGISM